MSVAMTRNIQKKTMQKSVEVEGGYVGEKGN